jgi:hypothetical protein
MSTPKYRKKPLTEDLSKMSIREKPSHKRDDRTEIFESKVSDKTIIQRNKLKTQMCKRFTETGYCQYGKGCHFAHDKSEIRKPICFFGDKCKDKKNCGYDHSTEEIPELPPVEQQPKIWEVEVSPVTKEEEMIIDLEPEDTFKIHDKPNKLEKLRKMMEEAEEDADFKLELVNSMKSYLRKTFTPRNTMYIENTGKKSVKFIAIEADDEEFEAIIDRIYQTLGLDHQQ